jgi:hypothetical protein
MQRVWTAWAVPTEDDFALLTCMLVLLQLTEDDI